MRTNFSRATSRELKETLERIHDALGLSGDEKGTNILRHVEKASIAAKRRAFKEGFLQLRQNFYRWKRLLTGEIDPLCWHNLLSENPIGLSPWDKMFDIKRSHIFYRSRNI